MGARFSFDGQQWPGGYRVSVSSDGRGFPNGIALMHERPLSEEERGIAHVLLSKTGQRRVSIEGGEGIMDGRAEGMATIKSYSFRLASDGGWDSWAQLTLNSITPTRGVESA